MKLDHPSIESTKMICAVCKTEEEHMPFSSVKNIGNITKRVDLCSRKCFMAYQQLLDCVKDLLKYGILINGKNVESKKT